MSVNKPAKKLVQGRLSFQVIRTLDNDGLEVIETEKAKSVETESGKKKRSDSFEDNQAAKRPKLDDCEEVDLTLEDENGACGEEETPTSPMDEEDDDFVLIDVPLTVILDEDCNESVEDPKSTATPANKKTITPKQLGKQLEAAKRREEKEKMKLEKNLKKEEEKREKLKLKEERENLKKKELEFKELEKKKIKEEKERRKQQEIDMKNEEKLRKDAEKKKKEEEDLLNKKKYAKEAAVFTNFFTKVNAADKNESVVKITTLFKPFAVKNRMRLAPILRNPLDAARRVAMDDALNREADTQLYLAQLKNGTFKPKHSPNTWPLEELYQDDDPEVEVITEENGTTKLEKENQRPKNYQPKLLQFCENRRPPYWGTWRKRATTVGPRRPFGHYPSFDYDVESDEEWEEEEPGESLHGSDDEKEKEDGEGDDDYEVDNEVFVPHGYLSEDEAQPDEAWDVEQQKEKLKLLGEQFDNERNEKTKKLRPVVVGCIWLDDESKFTAGNPKLEALFLRCIPIPNDCKLPLAIEINDANLCFDGREGDATSPGSVLRRGAFPDEAIPLLVARLHGAILRRRALAREFVTEWINQQKSPNLLSVAAVSKKIRELAQWHPVQGRWLILPELREKYVCSNFDLTSVDDLPTPTAIFSPASIKITKFTKKLTEDERRSSLKPRTTGNEESAESTNKDNSTAPMVEKTIQKLGQFRVNPTPAAKKRVAILCSTPLGVPIPAAKDAVTEPPKTDETATTTLRIP